MNIGCTDSIIQSLIERKQFYWKYFKKKSLYNQSTNTV